MKLTISRQSLLRAIEKVEGVSDDRSTVSTLGYVRLMAFKADADAGATLQLAGTNLRMALETTVQADVVEDGKLLTSVKPLGRIIRSLTSEVVSLTYDGTSLVVKGIGTARTHKLPTRPADEMPKIPLPPKDGALSLQSSLIESLVSRVQHASDPAPNTGRSGVMMEIDGDAIAVVAANGYQLAAVTGTCGCSPEVKWERLIPSVAHKALFELCDDSETVSITQDANHIFIETEESMIACMTPMEPFVPWRNVLKMIEPRPIATVNAEALIASVRGVTCVKPDSTVSLKFSRLGKLKIEALEDGAGDSLLGAIDIIDCATVERDTELCVSAPLLIANVKSAATDVVSLKHSEPNHLTVTSGDYQSLVALIAKSAPKTEPEQEEKPAKKASKK